MKQTYLLLFTLLSFAFSQAQIIDIPDTNFKDALVNYNVADLYGNYTYGNNVDTNNDGEIQVSEAEAVIGLNNFPSGINDLTGIEYFTNLVNLDTPSGITSLNVTQNILLEQLYCGNSQLTTLDVSQNVNLIRFGCAYSELTTLDVTQNVHLEELSVSENQISSLDLSQNVNLEKLWVDSNELSSLDVSQHPNLFWLYCGRNQLTNINVSQNPYLRLFGCEYNQLTNIDLSQNDRLVELNCSNNLITDLDTSQNSDLVSLKSNDNSLNSLNIKNDYIIEDASYTYYIDISDNPNLSYICVDEEELDGIQDLIISNGYDDCVVNAYCSFGPGGELYEITGNSKLDNNGNGCDDQDLVFPQLEVTINDGSNSSSFIANTSGAYNIPLAYDEYSFTPVLENPDYFNISPSSFTVDFFSDSNPYNQDFCITANGVKNDLEIVIIPLKQARPGFDTNYELVYKNKGNTTLSGMLSLDFQNELMDLVSSNPAVNTQTIGNLSWNFSDLQPFETRSIHFTMNINTPTDTNFPVNGNDVLIFMSNISPLLGDETPEDNVFILNQNVVNSYDPNDKTCLEGATITPDEVGDYVHYMIRFENTGTASAVNIVVRDEIDKFKYDISTLKSVIGSHDFVTRIKDTDMVEFIFEDINLPEDDANNDGYVVFKIKTWSTLDLGDIFRNSAEIYFDYNAPILTNTAVTTVAESLFVDDFDLEATVKLYPNPVSNYLFIESSAVLETIKLNDINGRLLQTFVSTDNQFEEKLDISKLNGGVYFVTIVSNKGDITKKFIKE